jgi:hypothetical protein
MTGQDEPLCEMRADQRDRPADEPRQASSESLTSGRAPDGAAAGRRRAGSTIEDDLGLDDVVEAGDMFEGKATSPISS